MTGKNASPDVFPDTHLIVGLANIAVNSRSYSHTLRLFAWMETHDIPLNPVAYSVLLKCHGRSRNTGAVKKVFADMREHNIPFDTVLLNSLADALVRCDDVHAARQLLLNQSYAHVVDARTYNTVIKGLIHRRQISQAFLLAERMRDSGISPTAVTLNTLLSACVARGDFQAAFRLFDQYATDGSCDDVQFFAPLRPPVPSDELKKVLKSSESEDNAVNPPPGEQANEGDALEIDGYLNNPTSAPVDRSHTRIPPQLESIPIASQTYPEPSTLLTALVSPTSKGQSEKQNGRVEQLRIAMTSLLSGLAERGRLSEAHELLHGMMARGVCPSAITYAALLTAFFRRGDVRGATGVFDALQKVDAGVLASSEGLCVCNALVAGFCGTGDAWCVEEAAAIVGWMLSASVKDDKDDEDLRVTGMLGTSNMVLLSQPLTRPTNETFAHLIEGYVVLGELYVAERCINIMMSHHINPSAVPFTILMKGHAEQGRHDQVMRLFREMSSKSIKPDRVAFDVFIAACARTKDDVSVKRILEYMERQGGGLTPGARTYMPLLKLYARLRDDEGVWGVYGRMRSRGIALNDYVVSFMSMYVVRTVEDGRWRRGPAVEILAERAAQMLRDGLGDGVSASALKKGKRAISEVLVPSVRRRYFADLQQDEFRSASEAIFEKHGWNDIQSGWRFL